eukprot:990316-Pyramimonas_sp.AAC.2
MDTYGTTRRTLVYEDVDSNLRTPSTSGDGAAIQQDVELVVDYAKQDAYGKRSLRGRKRCRTLRFWTLIPNCWLRLWCPQDDPTTTLLSEDQVYETRSTKRPLTDYGAVVKQEIELGVECVSQDAAPPEHEYGEVRSACVAIFKLTLATPSTINHTKI